MTKSFKLGAAEFWLPVAVLYSSNPQPTEVGPVDTRNVKPVVHLHVSAHATNTWSYVPLNNMVLKCRNRIFTRLHHVIYRTVTGPIWHSVKIWWKGPLWEGKDSRIMEMTGRIQSSAVILIGSETYVVYY
jgi:hypothetical protein